MARAGGQAFHYHSSSDYCRCTLLPGGRWAGGGRGRGELAGGGWAGGDAHVRGGAAGRRTWRRGVYYRQAALVFWRRFIQAEMDGGVCGALRIKRRCIAPAARRQTF